MRYKSKIHEIFATDLPNQTSCFTGAKECNTNTILHANNIKDVSLHSSRTETHVISRFSSDESSLEISRSTIAVNDNFGGKISIDEGYAVYSHRFSHVSSSPSENVENQLCTSHSYKVFPPLVQDGVSDEQDRKVHSERDGYFCEVFALQHPQYSKLSTDQHIINRDDDQIRRSESKQNNLGEIDATNLASTEGMIKGSSNMVNSNTISTSTSATSLQKQSERSLKSNDTTNNVASLLIRGTWLSHWNETYHNPNNATWKQQKNLNVQLQTVALNYHALPIHIADMFMPSICNPETEKKVLNENIVPGIFVASSDNTMIRLFIPCAKYSIPFIEYETKNQNHHQAPNSNTLNSSNHEFSNLNDFSRPSFPLSFSSPVMALSSLLVKTTDLLGNDTVYQEPIENGHISYLAVGCQDGSIHIVLYKNIPKQDNDELDRYLFHVDILNVYSFHIDGPIISLHLSFQKKNKKKLFVSQKDAKKNEIIGYVHLFVGSLCGFTSQFYQSIPSHFCGPSCFTTQHDKTQQSHLNNLPLFYGPFFVFHADTENNNKVSNGPAQSKEYNKHQSYVEKIRGNMPILLWDGKLDAEDAILAVHAFQAPMISGFGVAIGTYSGRVFLYECILANDTFHSEALNTEENGIFATNFKFDLLWQDQLPYPVHSISVADVDDDNLSEIVVTTRKSIHIFHFDYDDVANATKQWLQLITTENTGI